MTDKRTSEASIISEGGVDRVISDLAKSASLQFSNLIRFDPMTVNYNNNPSKYLLSMSDSLSSVQSSTRTPLIDGAKVENIGSSSSADDGLFVSVLSKFQYNIGMRDAVITSIPTISTYIEQSMGQYLYAISVGAMLGAAVAAGVGVGIVAASGCVSGLNYYIPSFWNKALKNLGFRKVIKASGDDSPQISDSVDVDSKHHQQQQQGVNLQSPGETEGGKLKSSFDTKIIYLKQKHNGDERVAIVKGEVGPVRDYQIDSRDQCRQCLDSVTVILGKHMFSWPNVRNMNVYLVTGSCSAKVFKSVLSDYPLSPETTIVSILYVQSVENEASCIQIEATVCG